MVFSKFCFWTGRWEENSC